MLTDSAGQLDLTCKRTGLETYLTPYIKVNSKQMKDLNVKAATIKLLKENIGVNLCDLLLGNDFTDVTLKSQATKEG